MYPRSGSGLKPRSPRCALIYFGNLEAGATVKQITAFEKAIGRKLPEEVRASFRAHNGQPQAWNHPFFSGLDLYSLEDASRIWEGWAALENEDDLNEAANRQKS